jgi:hypothetical protein
MVLGNLPLFLERDELFDNDVVSYTFGDQEALYLRGQWTLHRNELRVSSVWKGCPHLGQGLQKELLLKVAWVRRMESRGIQNYPKRFQSAEGCYSQKAVELPHMRIKMSNKQFVGLTVPSDEQIYSVDGAIWQCARDAQVDVEQLALHSARGRCLLELPGVQNAVGERMPLTIDAEACGRWMPVEYRMCAPQLISQGTEVSASTSTYFVNGGFYSQRFAAAPGFVLPNGCRQGAFFHFQEWKKAWAGQGGYGATTGIEPLGEGPRYSARVRNFTISTEGISVITSRLGPHGV